MNSPLVAAIIRTQGDVFVVSNQLRFKKFLGGAGHKIYQAEQDISKEIQEDIFSAAGAATAV